MPASQLHIDSNTYPGANLVPGGGATFRTWASAAHEVYLALNYSGSAAAFPKLQSDLLVKDADGWWGGFFPMAKAGDLYRFYIVGTGSEGFKRDPYARELEMNGYPDCDCIIRDPGEYQWQDAGFRPPWFNDLIIYQFHIGVFYAKDASGKDIRRGRVCKILDVVDRIEYFADLGINAVMPLPFDEYQTDNSLGYNGSDLFSPEMDYCVRDADLAPYITRVNQLLVKKGKPPLAQAALRGQSNQVKLFIDLCHLYGIAVIADVVYNHGGPGFDSQSMWFYDRQPEGDDNNSLYFTNKEHASGREFAFWKKEVRQFLIDNARMLLVDYHLDGLRYDQITVIAQSGGKKFCRDLTSTMRYVKANAVQIAEYWPYFGNDRWQGVSQSDEGLGCDIGYSDVLRDNVRATLSEAAGGKSAHVNLDRVRDALYTTYRYPDRWTVFQCLENHDLEYFQHTGKDRQPRIAALGDSSNPRSWYARSRAKVATGLLLTAPGVPMIFMGQEFLEDKYWDDWQGRPELLIWWEGLEGKDKAMSDQHRFTRDFMWLRRKQPALRADGLNVFHVHNDNRIIAFHRWVPGIGRDVVIVASLSETTYYDHSYRLGFPGGGHWKEVFNSDVYDEWVNPNVQGNAGGITADGPGIHTLPASAGITIPANSLLVFARDKGDFWP